MGYICLHFSTPRLLPTHHCMMSGARPAMEAPIIDNQKALVSASSARMARSHAAWALCTRCTLGGRHVDVMRR